MKRTLMGMCSAVMLAVGVWPGSIASAGTCPITLPQGSEPVNLDPADFVSQIDNLYWPMAPGSSSTTPSAAAVSIARSSSPPSLSARAASTSRLKRRPRTEASRSMSST
ncbi:hypothetical protein BH18ACT17_BH18ACT17_13000 [soil metagenome]